MNTDLWGTILGIVKATAQGVKEYAPAPFNLIGTGLWMIADIVSGYLMNKPGIQNAQAIKDVTNK